MVEAVVFIIRQLPESKVSRLFRLSIRPETRIRVHLDHSRTFSRKMIVSAARISPGV